MRDRVPQRPVPQPCGAVVRAVVGSPRDHLRPAAASFYRPVVSATSWDVIVIGAGAAGLAAASHLAAAGCAVLLLEGRDRIGGRIWTRREAGMPVPIELGAEFIHGSAAITRKLLAQAGSTAIESADQHVTLEEGKLKTRESFLPKIQRAMRGTRILAERDMSFDDFLDQHLERVLSAEERQFARTMAEGFDAADTSRASARALAAEWTAGTLGATPQSRPRDGYQSLLEALVAPLHGSRVRLQLDSAVREVRWAKQAVEVSGDFLGAPFTLSGRRAIVAVPLGVLQSAARAAGALRFTPAIEAKHAALAALASGPVVKILLRFAEAFWETLQDGRYRDVSFFHAPHAQIPTFWTCAPARAPLLVAWAGGPRAQAVSAGTTAGELVRKAVASLGKLFGKGVDISGQLEGYYYHDWQQDPFARGAYSYVTVGGSDARAGLARPLDDTLFFAGEATAGAGEGGTVTGALQSGLRAAREVLNA
jgi:monoamine oxidase